MWLCPISWGVVLMVLVLTAGSGRHADEVSDRRKQRQVQPDHSSACKACSPQGMLNDFCLSTCWVGLEMIREG